MKDNIYKGIKSEEELAELLNNPIIQKEIEFTKLNTERQIATSFFLFLVPFS